MALSHIIHCHQPRGPQTGCLTEPNQASPVVRAFCYDISGPLRFIFQRLPLSLMNAKRSRRSVGMSKIYPAYRNLFRLSIKNELHCATSFRTTSEVVRRFSLRIVSVLQTVQTPRVFACLSSVVVMSLSRLAGLIFRVSSQICS